MGDEQDGLFPVGCLPVTRSGTGDTSQGASAISSLAEAVQTQDYGDHRRPQIIELQRDFWMTYYPG